MVRLEIPDRPKVLPHLDNPTPTNPLVEEIGDLGNQLKFLQKLLSTLLLFQLIGDFGSFWTTALAGEGWYPRFRNYFETKEPVSIVMTIYALDLISTGLLLCFIMNLANLNVVALRLWNLLYGLASVVTAATFCWVKWTSIRSGSWESELNNDDDDLVFLVGTFYRLLLIAILSRFCTVAVKRIRKMDAWASNQFPAIKGGLIPDPSCVTIGIELGVGQEDKVLAKEGEAMSQSAGETA